MNLVIRNKMFYNLLITCVVDVNKCKYFKNIGNIFLVSTLYKCVVLLRRIKNANRCCEFC